MKKIKKTLMVILLVILATATFNSNNFVEAKSDSIEVEPRPIVTEWIYQYFDGLLYKRLWNKTEGYWLTAWILVG